MNIIEFQGCRSHESSPISSYLLALGAFKLLAEQKDVEAHMHWQNGVPMISTRLSKDEVSNFFLDEYQPSPILSPWNNGNLLIKGRLIEQELYRAAMVDSDKQIVYNHKVACQYPEYKKEAAAGEDKGHSQKLELLRNASDSRFSSLQSDVKIIFETIDSLKEPMKKSDFIQLLRGKLSDKAIQWIDIAAVCIDGEVTYPPLSLSGGNDGNAEISSHFLGNLILVLLGESPTSPESSGLPSRDSSKKWLEHALFDRISSEELIVKKKYEIGGEKTDLGGWIGLFDPNFAGGANENSGHIKAIVNPWSLVLAIEGMLMFAGGISRRNDSVSGEPTAPFSAKLTSPFGHGSLADEKSSGEIWLPLWNNPTNIRELLRLFREGRASWNGKQAIRGLNFAKAIKTLGVDRGMEEFGRYAFLKRRGKSYSAVKIGTFSTKEIPEINSSSKLDGWVKRLRSNKSKRDKQSKRISGAYDRIRSAEFALIRADEPNEAPGLLADILSEVAIAEGDIGISGTKIKENFSPVGVYSSPNDFKASEWLPNLYDGTPEMEFAICLASLIDKNGKRKITTLAKYLRPVEFDDRGNIGVQQGGTKLLWRDQGAMVTGLSRTGVSNVLSRVMIRRSMEIDSLAPDAEIRVSQVGILPGFSQGIYITPETLTRFLEGELDEERISKLLVALLLLDWRCLGENEIRYFVKDSSDYQIGYLSPTWCVLSYFFHRETLRTREFLTSPASWSKQLSTGNIPFVIKQGLQRLKIAGLIPDIEETIAGSASIDTGERLLTSLMPQVRPDHLHEALMRFCRYGENSQKIGSAA